MPKPEDESNADGLEIVSIGTLYDGPWDKKYWSSSRGKDRFPYSVGYHALRTHNGVTYKMEIHEGSAGPLFQITSSNGHSGSGQTPDIAWETFQRKTSRIKLWHTKRFSCKADGVEFFGFKNILVQRLLRELLTSLDGASERHLPSIKVGNRSLTKEGDITSADLSKHPDLLSCITTPRITGKRRKKCKTTNVNSAQKLDNKASTINIPIKEKDENSALVSSFREAHIVCNGVQDIPSSVNLNHHQDAPASASELSCKSHQISGDCDDKQYSAQLLETRNHLKSTPVNNEHFEQETFSVLQSDWLKCLDAQKFNPLIESELEIEESQTVNDSEVSEDSEINKNNLLYAPDTLDTQQEVTSLPYITNIEESCKKKDDLGADDTITSDTQQGVTSPPNITSIEESCKKKDELGADDTITADKPVVGSCPEEETENDSADRSDFDSVGQEVAQSMMSILLPKALPFLTYSSRKKKRKLNPLKQSSGTLRTNHDNNHLSSAGGVSYGELGGNSNFDRQKEEPMPNIYLGSTLHGTEISVAPDSLEDNSCRADLPYQVKWLSDVTEPGKASFGKHKSSSDKQRMPSTVNSIMESGTCQSKMDLEKETETLIPAEYSVSATLSSKDHTVLECLQNDHSEADAASQMQQLSCASDAVVGNSAADKPLEDNTLMLDSAVDCTSYGRKVHKPIDNCLHLVDTYRIKSQPKEDEFAVTSDCNGGRIQYNSLGPVESLRIPEEPMRTGTYEAGNSNIFQTSSVELYVKSYIGPFSESILCRNIRDGSLFKEEPSSSGNENKDDVVISSELECNTKVIGCYSHSNRISAVMLKLEVDNIYVCMSCGLLEETGRDLYLYKFQIKGPSLGSPSFIGHSTIILPIMKDDYGREVRVEMSGLQFTPDARGLVMLDTIQVPYCSERRLVCPCSTCASIRFEDNAVKIVQVKKGYVLLLVKFKTVYPVNSVLVCEPNCLVALDESGRLYLWFMDLVWSASTEDYVIPTYDFVASRVVELKRIPKSASLLLGHNGCGDFSLWDITRRTILTTFSAPASSIHGFLPVSSFSWQNERVCGKDDAEKWKDELMAATTTSLREFNGNITFSPRKDEDIGVWILVCTSTDSSFHPRNSQTSSESWSLGLLVKNMVILGTSFPRSTVIGVSAGHGIIGTDEGLAYMWDLKAGNKVEVLHNFKGVGVSHIATDDSTPSAAIAVAGENGQLWIYLNQSNVLESM